MTLPKIQVVVTYLQFQIQVCFLSAFSSRNVANKVTFSSCDPKPLLMIFNFEPYLDVFSIPAYQISRSKVISFESYSIDTYTKDRVFYLNHVSIYKNLKAKILCGGWHHKVRRLSNMIKIGVHSVTLHDRCYSLYRRTLRLKHGWYRDRGGSLVTPAAWSLVLQLTPTDADSRLQQMLRENTSNMAESFDVTHHSPRDRFPSPLLVMVCLARHKYNVNYSETATTKMFDSFNSTEKCRAHFNELLSVLTALSAVNETNLNSSSTWYPDAVRLSHNAEKCINGGHISHISCMSRCPSTILSETLFTDR